jgi:hypothetical protein
MVDVTPVGATARHLLLEQLGALALDRDPLVKLGHLGLRVSLQHAQKMGIFRAVQPISPIASSDVSYKLG